IAIRTGAESGIVVLDIDDRAAWAEVKKLFPNQYDWASVPRQKTGKPDGWHLFFRHPGTPVKSGVKFLPGVDSRADGGYIIAAPSAHISGNRYQWKHLPPNDQFPTLPTELLLAINGFGMRDSGSPRFDPSFIWEGIPEGQPDDQLFRYACKMRHN